MISASGILAREVLLADAANLLPNIFRAGQGREPDAIYVVTAVEVSVSIAGARNPGGESGPLKGLVSIVRPGEVTR